jgi:hypothetical protein
LDKLLHLGAPLPCLSLVLTIASVSTLLPLKLKLTLPHRTNHFLLHQLHLQRLQLLLRISKPPLQTTLLLQPFLHLLLLELDLAFQPLHHLVILLLQLFLLIHRIEHRLLVLVKL